MRRFQSSIAGLLGVVVFVAVALAALLASTDAWDSGLVGLVLLMLLTATLLTIHRTDRKRAFWLGFALFGWAYLSTSLIPAIESRLPTTKGLAFLGTTRTWPPPEELPYFDYDSDGSFDLLVARASPPNLPYFIAASGTPENFCHIGYSLLALVMAFIGGRLSRWLYDKKHIGVVGDGDHPTDERRRP